MAFSAGYRTNKRNFLLPPQKSFDRAMQLLANFVHRDRAIRIEADNSVRLWCIDRAMEAQLLALNNNCNIKINILRN